jgi:parvulin-like peptidyl-prolyl isomerase
MAKRVKQELERAKEKEKELTKKQIAHSRRQREQQMRAYIALGVVGALILIVVVVALYDLLVAQPARPVAIVNNVPITVAEYQARDRYQRYILDTQLQQLQAEISSLSASQDPTSSFLVQYYQQYANQIYQERLGVDQTVLNTMVGEEVVRQKAAELKLTVSDAELNDSIRAGIASQSGFVTQAEATSAVSTAVAATATALTFTPTPLPTATPTPTATLTATVVASPTEMLPTPGPTPTPHIITDAEFSQNYANYLKTLQDKAGITEAQFRSYVEAQLLTQKVQQYFADQVPTEAEQTNVSDIQVPTQAEADAVRKELEAGQDFKVVATKVSSDTYTAPQGGEMGWFLKGDLSQQYSSAFEDAVAALQPGQISQPISSTIMSAWYILKVNDRKVRTLDPNQLRTEQQKAYSTWLTSATSGPGVKILWTPNMAPPDPYVATAEAGTGGQIPVSTP